MRKDPESFQRCRTISTIQKLLGGKWKLEILYYVGVSGLHRFGQLRRCLGNVTESSLTKQLRELERDGFLHRRDFQEVPPHVEYTLTELGTSFLELLHAMKAWGEVHLPEDPEE